LGATIIEQRGFPDHHRYAESDIASLAAMARDHDATLVTTEKDWVRLPSIYRDQVRVLKVTLRWDDEAALAHLLAPVLAPAVVGGAHG
jgi:tetraacyldisaccharide 4'-kinase